MVMELRNYGITEKRINGRTEGQGKSNIAPLFQSGAIINELYGYGLLQRKKRQNRRTLIEKSGHSHLRSFVIVIRSA